MTWELYAAYLVATVIVLTIPGPTVMLVISYALAEGRRSAWATIGRSLGQFSKWAIQAVISSNKSGP